MVVNPNYDDIFDDILAQIEVLVEIIRPTKVLVIAVDGIAPRAKLNQQRSRRFRTSKTSKEAIASYNSRNESKFDSEIGGFDSNCITPGTSFMYQLDLRIKNFVELKLKSGDEESLWKGLEVHFSGSSVPGEGEHKIISYIRNWKNSEAYRTNTRHCIHGADADMIMLSLATHEPFFLVMRDIPETYRPKRKKCSSTHNITTANSASTSGADLNKLLFIRINILREYLVNDLLEDLPLLGLEVDFERLIDDFVFLTFLVGNDFLPSLPAIDIGDGAFDIIFESYKTVFASSVGGLDYDGDDEAHTETDQNLYLVDKGVVNAKKLEMLFAIISVLELSMYQENEGMKEIRRLRKLKQQIDHDKIADYFSPEEEYKQQYYQRKFDIDISSELGKMELQNIRNAYFNGLSWCLNYYVRGCISWSWFYPYHFGPFLQDMVGLEEVFASMSFSLDAPLTPFQQLLACLPSSSKLLLPTCYHRLMCDMDSPLLQYYPLDFKIDMNDKKREWEAVVLLPFIDLQLLLQSEAMQCPPTLLTLEEQQRNRFGNSCIFRRDSVALSVIVTEFPPDIHPSPSAFEPYLPIGTLPSLQGFPTLSKIVVTKGNAKKSDSVSETYNSKRERRQRNAAARKNLVAISADSQFPMLGDPGKQTWTTSATSDAPHLGIRFLLNDDVNVFLFDMVEQIRLQSPHNFHTDFNLSADLVESSSLSSLSLKVPAEYSAGIYGIDYSTQDNKLSVSSQLVDEIIGKVCNIFGTVRGKLVPTCSVDISTGLVSIRFEDVSHLAQIEYFLSNKLSTLCFSDGHANGNGNKECIQSNRKIVIGRYTGSDATKFESWLNTEVSTIALYLPLFTSRVLEVYLCSSSSDGSQVKQYVLYGREN
eukprot:gene29762-38905_t